MENKIIVFCISFFPLNDCTMKWKLQEEISWGVRHVKILFAGKTIAFYIKKRLNYQKTPNLNFPF